MSPQAQRCKDPLTILMVTNNYIPYSGGVVNSLQVTCDALQRLGYRVIIVTLDFTLLRSCGASKGKQDKRGEEEVGVIRLFCPLRFSYRGNPMAIPFFSSYQMRRIINEYQPDIVHVHHPWLLGASAKKIAQKNDIPVVFTHHTLYEHYAHNVPLFQPLVKFVIAKSVKKFCETVDAVIVPSASTQVFLEQQGIIAHVVPSGILPYFIASQRRGGEYRRDKNSDSPSNPEQCRRMQQVNLLTVSRFTKEKNIPLLLDLIKKMGPGYRLTLIGFGNQHEALMAYAYETLGLSPAQVQFIVKPNKETIFDWYQKAHLFVFASVSETQGLVLAEAMASGMPVIALRGPGVIDIIENGVNGYIIDSVDEMASKITEIMQDQQLYQALQHGAHETAEQYYPDNTIRALIAVYEKLLCEKK